jgi:hypothetical protein
MTEWLTIAALAVIGAVAAYFYGLRRAGQKTIEDDARSYQKTMEAINEVVPAADVDAARDSLRARLKARPVRGSGSTND